MPSRNQEIAVALEQEKVPVLPFEVELAQRALLSHIKKQDDLGRQLGEAMNQSSETWHDNAPAEAIANSSKILEKTAGETLRIVNNSVVFSHEASEADGVTLGSLVSVLYDGDDDESHLYITGATRKITDEIEQSLGNFDDLFVATITSPIGSALLGARVGDRVTYETPSGAKLGVQVNAISQAMIGAATN